MAPEPINKLNWGGYFESVQECMKDEDISWQKLKELDPIFEILENIENAQDIKSIKSVVEWTSVNAQNKLNSPLLDALCDNLETVQKDESYKSENEKYYTFDFPLNVFYNGNEDACKFILSKGYFYAPSCKDAQGQWPMGTGPQYIIYSSKYDMVEIVKLLVKDNFHNKFNHDIFKNKHVKIIHYFMEKIRNCDCRSCKKDMLESFFLEGATHGILEIMQFMLENKVVDLSKMMRQYTHNGRYELPGDLLGSIAFNQAVQHNQLEVVKFLFTLTLEYKFDISKAVIVAEQKKYKVMVEFLYSQTTEQDMENIFISAVCYGMLELVEKLFIPSNIPLNNRALDCAARVNDSYMVKFFLEKGVAVTVIHEDTILYLLERENRYCKPVMKLLREYGANIPLPPHERCIIL